VNKIILLVFFLFVLLSCKSDNEELAICETACDNGVLLDQLENVRAKVIVNNTYSDDDGGVSTIYAITINPDDLDSDTWTVEPDLILAPCNLPNNYKKGNLNIILSGNRKSCCNQLTKPNFKTSYGCVFEITKIEKE